jgi:F420H(2)-dependent quinone reductase
VRASLQGQDAPWVVHGVTPAAARRDRRPGQSSSKQRPASLTEQIARANGTAAAGPSALPVIERVWWIQLVSGWTQVQRLGGTRLGVWAIKHVVAPLQLSVHRYTSGRLSLTGRAPILLLTTTGRRTGKRRTVPVFYLRDGDGYVVCNVRPPRERTNPWVLNVLADPHVRLTLHGQTVDGLARRAEQSEVDRYWPALVRLWPAYRSFRDAGGELSIFVFEADRDSASKPGFHPGAQAHVHAVEDRVPGPPAHHITGSWVRPPVSRSARTVS